MAGQYTTELKVNLVTGPILSFKYPDVSEVYVPLLGELLVKLSIHRAERKLRSKRMSQLCHANKGVGSDM